jgi:hypothetical protein
MGFGSAVSNISSPVPANGYRQHPEQHESKDKAGGAVFCATVVVDNVLRQVYGHRVPPSQG